MNIVIIGAGGVGGYFGGKLALAGYPTTFIARGISLDTIKKNGLQVKSILGDFHVYPEVTDNFEVIKTAGLILLCVKSWQIEVIAQKGIIGDRNFDQHRSPGQNISLIEGENIALFNQCQQQNINIQDTRRNLITQGIELKPLVGQTFYIGQVKLLGIEQCQPCRSLGEKLTNDNLSQQQVIKVFTDKAGIRAAIISNGHIEIGMPITIDSADL